MKIHRFGKSLCSDSSVESISSNDMSSSETKIQGSVPLVSSSEIKIEGRGFRFTYNYETINKESGSSLGHVNFTGLKTPNLTKASLEVAREILIKLDVEKNKVNLLYLTITNWHEMDPNTDKRGKMRNFMIWYMHQHNDRFLGFKNTILPCNPVGSRLTEDLIFELTKKIEVEREATLSLKNVIAGITNWKELSDDE